MDGFGWVRWVGLGFLPVEAHGLIWEIWVGWFGWVGQSRWVRFGGLGWLGWVWFGFF